MNTSCRIWQCPTQISEWRNTVRSHVELPHEKNRIERLYKRIRFSNYVSKILKFWNSNIIYSPSLHKKLHMQVWTCQRFETEAQLPKLNEKKLLLHQIKSSAVKWTPKNHNASSRPIVYLLSSLTYNNI